MIVFFEYLRRCRHLHHYRYRHFYQHHHSSILFHSILGCVLPLQEVALRQSPPTFKTIVANVNIITTIVVIVVIIFTMATTLAGSTSQTCPWSQLMLANVALILYDYFHRRRPFHHYRKHCNIISNTISVDTNVIIITIVALV